MNKRIIKLDIKDRKILYQLDINARQTNTRIAKSVGLSKESVAYRINRLVGNGVIKYFMTIIDTTKLDLLFFRTYVKFYSLTKTLEEDIIDFLRARVGWFVNIRGPWDINIATWARSVYEFRDFWNEFRDRYENHIDRHWTSLVTRMWHYSRSYLIEENAGKPAYDLLGENPVPVMIDMTDYRILEKLSTNGRMRFVEIAKSLGIGEKTVRDRVRNLIRNGVILRFRPFLDIEKLGYEYYKLHFRLRNMDSKTRRSLINYVHQHPHIVYMTEAIGGADLELEAHVRNTAELYGIIDSLRERFEGKILDCEFMQYIKENKFVYLPVRRG